MRLCTVSNKRTAVLQSNRTSSSCFVSPFHSYSDVTDGMTVAHAISFPAGHASNRASFRVCGYRTIQENKISHDPAHSTLYSQPYEYFCFPPIKMQATGLDATTVAQKRLEFGYNELPTSARLRSCSLSRQFHNILIYILLGAVTISLLVPFIAEDT